MIISLLAQAPHLFFVWLVAILVPITLHEFAHAFAATMQGDPTAKQQGRLTFNPLAHIDLFGFLLLLFAGFGWGKPVPFNPLYLRNRRFGAAIVSAAGPIANALQIIVFGLTLRAVAGLGPENLLVILLVALVHINVILMVFNLLPIPPLDGSKVFFSLLPRTLSWLADALERYGPPVLIGLVFFDYLTGAGIFSRLFRVVSAAVFQLLG